jgi:hypothetical protein
MATGAVATSHIGLEYSDVGTIRGEDLQRLPIDLLASGSDRQRRPDPSASPLSVEEYVGTTPRH